MSSNSLNSLRLPVYITFRSEMSFCVRRRSEMSLCVCRFISFIEAREVHKSLKLLRSNTKSVENHLKNNTLEQTISNQSERYIRL